MQVTWICMHFLKIRSEWMPWVMVSVFSAGSWWGISEGGCPVWRSGPAQNLYFLRKSMYVVDWALIEKQILAYLLISLSVCLPVCVCLCLFLFLCLCLSACLTVCPSFSLVSVSVSVSMTLFPSIAVKQIITKTPFDTCLWCHKVNWHEYRRQFSFISGHCFNSVHEEGNVYIKLPGKNRKKSWLQT